MIKPTKRPVIICVDDEVTILTSLKAELRKAFAEEYQVEIAEGGEDALERRFSRIILIGAIAISVIITN